jgi:hypothetical protein
VMVASSDDLLEIRGERRHAIRDNVLIEYGMFLGKHGCKREWRPFVAGIPPHEPSWDPCSRSSKAGSTTSSSLPVSVGSRESPPLGAHPKGRSEYKAALGPASSCGTRADNNAFVTSTARNLASRAATSSSAAASTRRPRCHRPSTTRASPWPPESECLNGRRSFFWADRQRHRRPRHPPGHDPLGGFLLAVAIARRRSARPRPGARNRQGFRRTLHRRWRTRAAGRQGRRSPRTRG